MATQQDYDGSAGDRADDPPDSRPAFAPVPRPAAGAANVLVIVLDDLGFAQLGCFGSDIATPAIDGLAAGGLRYRRFHVTAMCSPTRACLLTGRNQHRVGMGFVADLPIGFPGYDGRIPPRRPPACPGCCATPATARSPSASGTSRPAGSRARRARSTTGRSGSASSATTGSSTATPTSGRPTSSPTTGSSRRPGRPRTATTSPRTWPTGPSASSSDQQHATPGKPFFCYLATGAVHAPHQAPAAVHRRLPRPVRRRVGGVARAHLRPPGRPRASSPTGTELAERPPWVPDWAALPPDERRLYARMMEVFAGFVTHTDAQIGRVLDFLRATDQLDDTLVLLISDNGTSGEGGPTGSFNEHRFTHDRVDDVADTLGPHRRAGRPPRLQPLPVGMGVGRQHAAAAVEALRLARRGAHAADRPLAGAASTTRPPARSATSSCHAVDLLPTVLDAAGVDAPGRGRRRRPAVARRAPACGRRSRPTAPTPRAAPPSTSRSSGRARSSTTGWKATTDHIGNQITVEREQVPGSHDFAADHWALFHLDEDFAEAHDLAAEHPERVAAARGPLVARGRAATRCCPSTTAWSAGRWPWSATRGPPGHRVASTGPAAAASPRTSCPPWAAASASSPRSSVPDGGGEGVICALGDWSNGWAWYLLDGRPVVAFNLFGDAVPRGRRRRADRRASTRSRSALRARAPPAGGPLTPVRRRRGRRRRAAARGPPVPLADRRRRPAHRPRRRLPGERRLPPAVPVHRDDRPRRRRVGRLRAAGRPAPTSRSPEPPSGSNAPAPPAVGVPCPSCPRTIATIPERTRRCSVPTSSSPPTPPPRRRTAR